MTKARTQLGPTFMFVGASKAGSSWFFEILREHPQAFVPLNKATFFFTSYYEQGIGWYERFFSNAAPGCIKGEVCHDYLSSPAALARIAQYWPEMRIICCLRNPYERAISSWRFFGRNGMDLPTLAEQAARHPAVFEEGYYATHLSNLESHFPKEQVLVFFFEELAQSPERVARRLYEFIGVDGGFVPPSLHKRINVNAKPRSRALARFVQFVHQQSWKRSHLLSNLIGKTKRVKPLRQLVRTALYKHPVKSTDWREHFGDFPESVVARYEREISMLEERFGRPFREWRAPPKARTPLAPRSQSTEPAVASELASPRGDLRMDGD